MLRKFYLFLLTQKPIPAMDTTFGTQFDFLVNLVLLLKNISNLESTIIFYISVKNFYHLFLFLF